MPWTFSHPAAILPLRRWCPAWLNLAGLAIGAVTPDFGYYVHARGFARLAHSPMGSLVACVPSGIGLLIVFYVLRGPLWHLLPQPHRGALERAVSSPVPRRPGPILAALASLLIGAWTHILWDSSSHRYGWIVSHVAFLRSTAFIFDGEPVAFYRIVQHVSTVFGILCLGVAYRSWLRGQGVTTLLPFAATDRWRYGLLASAMLVAVGSGLFLANAVATSGESFVYDAAIQIVAVFVPLLSSAAVFCYRHRSAAAIRGRDSAD